MGPGAAVAGIRNAVRACLADLEPGDTVLVACSGGADSLALAAALAFVGPRLGLRGGAVTVDHGLQDGSAERAAGVVAVLQRLGLDPVYSVAVEVADAKAGGPEAAARAARYRALEEVAVRAVPGPVGSGAVRAGSGPGTGPAAQAEAGAPLRAESGMVTRTGDTTLARAGDRAPDRSRPAGRGEGVVLLGHTLDDQAETVLLGLARGAGGRSLAGMAERRGIYRRPLLGIRRAETMAACRELGLEPWQDPHNADPRYARARVRHQGLPALEAALGPGVAEALARTARQLRVDADFLDELAFAESERLRGSGSDPAGLPVSYLAALPEAIRTRVLRAAAIMAGSPPGALTARHVQQAEELVTCWHGQRWADLPGGVRARRRHGQLWFSNEAGHARETADTSQTGRDSQTGHARETAGAAGQTEQPGHGAGASDANEEDSGRE